MKIDTRINKCIVYIIESLPDGDLKTGRNLYEKLRQEWLSNADYESVYEVIHTKKELIQLLLELTEKVKAKDNHTFYILHFETHGCENGMYLSSDEEITWRDLFSMIRPINVYMYDTLLVVLSMCDSKSIAYNIEPGERSPFRGALVTDMPLTAGYIDTIWDGVYKNVMSHFFEDKTPYYFSDFTPEHISFFNQEFTFDVHSDMEEYHPEIFAEAKDRFTQEFYDLLKSHPNELFLMSRENYIRWRVDKWQREKKQLRDFFCFKDIIENDEKMGLRKIE